MSAFQPTIKRRESTKIYVGNVPIGGDAPIAVQSMTNTRTTDVEATVAQIKSLERVGVYVLILAILVVKIAYVPLLIVLVTKIFRFVLA